MHREGFAPIIIVLVAVGVLAIAGGLWYIAAHNRPTPSEPPPQSLPTPQVYRPSITLTPATGTLPDAVAVLGNAYYASATISVTSSNPDDTYAWSVSGAPPWATVATTTSGLGSSTLNFTVSGTPSTTGAVNLVFAATGLSSTVMGSSTFTFAVNAITFQDAVSPVLPPDTSVPNTITLGGASVINSSTRDQGSTESNFILSLKFKIVSGSAPNPGSALFNQNGAPFCTIDFGSVPQGGLWRVLDAKGDLARPDSIKPANKCIGKYTTLDNVAVNFIVPGPGSYTFVYKPNKDESPIINFTVNVSQNGSTNVQGPVAGLMTQPQPPQVQAPTSTENLTPTSTTMAASGADQRDAVRISDLRKMQNALELFYQDCGFYPGGVTAAGPCAAAAVPTTWTSSEPSVGGDITSIVPSVLTIPQDPNPNFSYSYWYSTGGTSYVLGALLEDPNNSAFPGYNPPPLPPGAVEVSDPGKTAPTNCTPTVSAPSYCIAL